MPKLNIFKRTLFSLIYILSYYQYTFQLKLQIIFQKQEKFQLYHSI